MQNVVALDQAKQQVDAVRLHAGTRAAGPDHPRRAVAYFDVLLARVQRRAGRSSRRRRCPSSSPRPSATSKSARRRSPTPTKRRPSTTRSSPARSDAQRPRQPAHGAARDHRPLPQGAEARRRRIRAAAAGAEHARLLGGSRARGATSASASRRRTSTSPRSRSTGPGRGTTRRSTWSRSYGAQGIERLGEHRRLQQLAHGAVGVAARTCRSIPGRLRSNSRVREAIALTGQGAAGPRDRRGAARCYNAQTAFFGRQQRGRVGQGVRAGACMSARRRASSRTSSARKSACAPTSTC